MNTQNVSQHDSILLRDMMPMDSVKDACEWAINKLAKFLGDAKILVVRLSTVRHQEKLRAFPACKPGYACSKPETPEARAMPIGDQMQSHAADMDASLNQLHSLQSAAAGLQSYNDSYTQLAQIKAAPNEHQIWAALKLAQERIDWFKRDAADATNVCKKPKKKKARVASPKP